MVEVITPKMIPVQKMMRKLLFVCVLGTLATACSSDKEFQEKYDFEDQTWPVDELPEFTIEVAETNLEYDVYYSIRHTQDYPFQNMYVQVRITGTEGEVLKSELQNVVLFDPKSGEPKGSGLGSLITRNVRGLRNFQFPEAGVYTFQFEQRNRAEVTTGIDSFGIWLEASK